MDEIEQLTPESSEENLDQTEPKKRRRRTLKNPAEAVPTDGTGEPIQVAEPKKRKKRVPKIDLENMAKQIQGFHTFLALATKTPELMLDEKDSTALAKSATDFAEEFGMVISNRVFVVVQLLTTCAFVYGPRIAHIKGRVARQRALETAMANEQADSGISENPAG